MKEPIAMAGRLEKQLKKKKPFDSPQQAVVIGLLRTHDMVFYRRAQFLREYGLTEPQYNVLRILRGEGGPLPCLEIADRMIAMVPAITRLMDRLEEANGWSKKEAVRIGEYGTSLLLPLAKSCWQKLTNPFTNTKNEYAKASTKPNACNLPNCWKNFGMVSSPKTNVVFFTPILYMSTPDESTI